MSATRCSASTAQRALFRLSAPLALAQQRLARLLPVWRLLQGLCHAVFPTRRGVLPAVRVLLDFLTERLPAELAKD